MVWEWIVFGVVVAVFLAADLFLHRGKHAESRKRAIIWSGVTIGVGVGFCGYVWWAKGAQAAHEYLAAYLLEESLSLDNLFVFLIIFRMMGTPLAQQRIALAWGIFGAMVLRGIFIFLGAEILNRWSWVEYLLAAILLYAAWRAFREKPDKPKKDNKLVAWLERHLPVSQPQTGPHFLVRENGTLKATPLLITIVALDISDVMFAVDSIPAAFSVTSETFLIYTSNVFAILGMRSLYVVLVHTIVGLRYLHYGLAGVLAFAGGKLLLAKWGIEVDPLVAVGVIVSTIGTAVAASLPHRKRSKQKPVVDSTETANQ